MLKKIATILLIVAVVFCFGKDFGKVNKGEVLSKDGNQMVFKSGRHLHKLRTVANGNVTLGKKTNITVIDTLHNFSIPASEGDYDPGLGDYQMQGDTVISEFNLLAPGKIKQIMLQTSTDGEAEFMVWAPSIFYDEDGSGYYNFPEFNNPDNSVPGSDPILPWSTTLECTGIIPGEQFDDNGYWDPTYNILDMETAYPAVNPRLSGDSLDCFVGYRINDANGPYTMMDAGGHDFPIKAWSTLMSQGQPSGTYYYWGNSDSRIYTAHMMAIVVEYEAVPPFIENATELSNIFSESATIRADIYDLDSENFTAEIQYKIGDNGDVQYEEMTATGNGDEYEGTLTASVGDTVFYAIKATDDGGLSNWSSDNYNEYVIKESPAGKSILVIREGTFSNDSLFKEVLDDEKTLYWIMEEENGLHRSVVNAGFDVVFVTGFGTTVVPIGQEEDLYGFGEFMDNGGDVALFDCDWFFANDITKGEYGEEVTLAEGDFAYDYFGIGRVINDPANDQTESIADTEFNGVTDHPLTGNFVEGTTYGPLQYSILGATNWGDYVYPNDAESSMTVFTGAESNESMAVANVTDNYKALYVAFLPEVIAAEQFSEFETLIGNILNITTAVDDDNQLATEFRLNQNYPNPFNPVTQIEFAIPHKSMVSLKIYDINGKLVRTLSNSVKTQGVYRSVWNATNDQGLKVSSGVYFYQLQTDDRIMTKKMLFIK